MVPKGALGSFVYVGDPTSVLINTPAGVEGQEFAYVNSSNSVAMFREIAGYLLMSLWPCVSRTHHVVIGDNDVNVLQYLSGRLEKIFTDRYNV